MLIFFSSSTQRLWHHKSTCYVIQAIVGYVWVCICMCVGGNFLCHDSELLRMLLDLNCGSSARCLHVESTSSVLEGKTYLLKIDVLIINFPSF